MEGFGFCVGLLALAWWLKMHRAEAAARQQVCSHPNDRFISLDDGGVWWSKHCPDCDLQTSYKVTRPRRSHPDNPLCYLGEQHRCDCEFTCREER